MPFCRAFFHGSLIGMRFAKILPLLCLSVFALSACETRILNTAQPLKIEITGADEAFCDIGSKYYRYQITAPGILQIERDSEPLKLDCRADGGKRRIMTIEPTMSGVYYRYPETISVNFAVVTNATRYNGFRGASPVGQPTVLTEDSFVAPVATSQTYPVPRTHAIVGRRSHPVPLQ